MLTQRTSLIAASVCILSVSISVPARSDETAQTRRDAVIVRAIERMEGVDLESNPVLKEAFLRHLDRSQGSREFVQLVKRFQPAGIETKLLETLTSGDRSAAVEAAEMMLELEAGRPLVWQSLGGENGKTVIEVLGLLGNGRANHFLSRLASDENVAFDRRRAAVEGLSRSRSGQSMLLYLGQEKKLVGDTFLIAGAMLARSKSGNVKEVAADVFPMPAQKDAKPLPPIDQLAKMQGDASRGKVLFRGTGTCSNCHIVSDYGKDVGPNLTEIGSKLTREAMLTAILAPSAGISHNYENYSVLTGEGQVITGLKVSETDDELTIRTADAIDRRISMDDVEQLKKSDKSIMPDNLHHLTGKDGLVDVVEYMMTLKKKG